MSDHLIAEANRHAKALTDERNNLVVELHLLREWQRETIQNERAHHAERKDANARAERAEAELANIRALANRRNKQNHSHDTTHQLVASLDQSLDIVQAELVEERWLKGCAIKRSQELLSELASERAIVSRIWVQLGSPTYAQLKGRSIYCLIDEMKAELAKERARLDWLEDHGWLTGEPCDRAAIDAAMKEGAK